MIKVRSGFTLIEVLLSIVLISLIAGFSVPFYQTFQVKNDVVIAANTVSQSLHRAQILSQSVAGDTSAGVYIGGGSIVVFRGASYGARDTNYDEVFNLPGSITPSGLQEVVFNKFTGLPQSNGTLTLSTSVGKTLNVTVNAKGMVDY